MTALDALLEYLKLHGVWVVFLVAAIEGPIVTVLSALLVRQGIFDLFPLLFVLISADLLGDIGFYALGRYGLDRLPLRLRSRVGLGASRTADLAGHFKRHGRKTLILGKLTHSAGAAVLVAAGAARMPATSFLFWNFMATVPKTLGFMTLGYFAGEAYARIDFWIGRISLVVLAVLFTVVTIWMLRRRQACTTPP